MTRQPPEIAELIAALGAYAPGVGFSGRHAQWCNKAHVEPSGTDCNCGALRVSAAIAAVSAKRWVESVDDGEREELARRCDDVASSIIDSADHTIDGDYRYPKAVRELAKGCARALRAGKAQHECPPHDWPGQGANCRACGVRQMPTEYEQRKAQPDPKQHIDAALGYHSAQALGLAKEIHAMPMRYGAGCSSCGCREMPHPQCRCACHTTRAAGLGDDATRNDARASEAVVVQPQGGGAEAGATESSDDAALRLAANWSETFRTVGVDGVDAEIVANAFDRIAARLAERGRERDALRAEVERLREAIRRAQMAVNGEE